MTEGSDRGGRIYVATASAAKVADGLRAYGEMAGGAHGLEGRFELPVHGPREEAEPREAWCVVELPGDLPSYHALNLVSWLTDASDAAAWEDVCRGAAGVLPAPSTEGRRWALRVDASSGGERLAGVDDGGEPVGYDLAADHPRRPDQPPAGAGAPDAIRAFLRDLGVPDELGEGPEGLPLHERVTLEAGGARGGGSKRSGGGQRPSKVAPGCSLLLFGGVTAFFVFLAFMGGAEAPLYVAPFIVGFGLATLHSLGVLLSGRPAVEVALGDDGTLHVARQILLWRRDRSLRVTELGRLVVERPSNHPDTATGSYADLRTRDGKRFVKVPVHALPSSLASFYGELARYNPALELAQRQGAHGEEKPLEA